MNNKLTTQARNQNRHVSVIGAGVGGLAAAVRMAGRGYGVTVFEQNGTPGGKAGEIRRDGFRWDTGPSLFTLPQLVDELLMLGHSPSPVSFTYDKLEVICTYFYDDGTRVKAWSRPEKFARELSRVTGENEAAVLKYLNDARNIYEAASGVFIFSPITRLFQNTLKLPLYRLKHLLVINPFRSMHAENKRRFTSDKVVQLFDRYATYNGSSPYHTPATLNVIAHLEHNLGAYFPKGGIYSLVEALYAKALSLGVKFKFNTRVEKLLFEGKQVAQIETAGGSFPAGQVISDLDVNAFYRNLIPQKSRPLKVRKPALSSSAVIFYWGMNREFSQLGVHNILFSQSYHLEFQHLFKRGELFSDPTVYIYISSKQNPGDAPRGSENWFVMINVPALNGHNWSSLKATAKNTIVEKIKRVLNVDPVKYIVSEQIATPQTIEQYTGSFKGALYGNNSNSIWSAFFRHPNYKKQFKNLYFTGGSVHPGGGIPLCLASAKLVEEEIVDSETTNTSTSPNASP